MTASTKSAHRPTATIVDFVQDPQLLGLSISPAQETLLRGIYGEPLISEEQRTLWRQCTGRNEYARQPFGEVTVIAGARAGKDSRIAAPIVVFEAALGGHEGHLARGERGVIPLVAQDARAAKIAFGYIREYITRSPLLRSLVDEVLASEIVLTNGMTITCFPCTLRSLRGWSMPAGVMDEVAFFRLEGQADSDVEVQASIRRGMISFPSPRLVKISTPYMKGGILFEDFKRGFGQDDPDLLVWRASSVLMNPALRAERLERQRRLDPERFSREYEAEFSDDVDAFLPGDWIESATMRGRFALPGQPDTIYTMAVDSSGGGPEHFTCAVVHVEGRGTDRRVVQDICKGWGRIGSVAPDLQAIVREIATIATPYHVRVVHGDRYASQWVVQAFRDAGLSYRQTTQDKGVYYLAVEPLFSQGYIRILDHPQLARELRTLERRPRPGGKTVVDHGSGGRDDYANSLALAAAVAMKGPDSRLLPWVGGTPRNDPEPLAPVGVIYG